MRVHDQDFVNRDVFAANFPSRASKEELVAFFSFEGTDEVKNVSSRVIGLYSLVFCTYYDVRDAKRAVEKLNGTLFQGSKVNVEYSKFEQDNKDKLVIFRRKEQVYKNMNTDDLKAFVSRWAEVMSIASVGKSFAFVRFYDTRALDLVLRKVSGQAFDGAVLEVRPYIKHREPEPEPRRRSSRSSRRSRSPRRKRERSPKPVAKVVVPAPMTPMMQPQIIYCIMPQQMQQLPFFQPQQLQPQQQTMSNLSAPVLRDPRKIKELAKALTKLGQKQQILQK